MTCARRGHQSEEAALRGAANCSRAIEANPRRAWARAHARASTIHVIIQSQLSAWVFSLRAHDF